MDATGAFLNSISRWPLLTPAQEIELARLHQKGLEVRRQVADSTPTREQRRLMRIGDRAGQRMVLCNLRLAVSIAKKYTRICKLNDFDDLVQFAAIGLQHAVSKFDPERGYKFSTYATKWVRQAVGRGIYNTDNAVYVPERLQQHWINLGRRAAAFAQEHGRAPTEDELLDGIDITPDRYRKVNAVMRGAVSLDARALEDGETIGELLAAPAPSDSDGEEAPAADYGRLMDCVDALSDKERDLITQRYGLRGTSPCTLKEAAAKCGRNRKTITESITRIQRKLHSSLTQPAA
jgi:RNA polymerase primary sigma factor